MSKEQELEKLSDLVSRGNINAIPSHKEVRNAFKALDLNDDGIIKKEDIQGVFEHLEIPLDEELHLLIKSYTSPTITYEDFIDQYHEYLFGTQATQHNQESNSETYEDQPDFSLQRISSKLTDLLTQGKSALQLNSTSTVSPEEVETTTTLKQSTIEILQKNHTAETKKLLEERDFLIAALAWLEKELSLDQKGLTVEETMKVIVELIREKDQEIGKQREVINDLIVRLRDKSKDVEIEEKPLVNTQSLTMLAKLQRQMSSAYMLNVILEHKNKNKDLESNSESSSIPPYVEEAIKQLSNEFEIQTNKCIEAAKQEAEMRKSIAEDNGWLWMQLTQLKKQLEELYSTGPKPKSDVDENCVIS